MRTQYYTATSLDGFIATEDDSLEWLFSLGNIEETSYPQFIAEVGALAMGSATYEWMLRHIVKADAPSPSAWPYAQPTWVFSRRQLPGVIGADIRFVSGDVRPVHEAMRAAAAGANVWIVGGGDLVGQFHDAGLLDDIIVQIGSVTLGSGKPLLPRQITSPSLRLVSVQRFGEGFAELRYEVPTRTVARPGPNELGRWMAARLTAFRCHCARTTYGRLTHHPAVRVTSPWTGLPAGLLISPRVAPPNFGLGLLEAIPDATLLALSDEFDRNHDGISGRVNMAWDVIAGRPAIGRFGLKSNTPALRQQSAGAYNGDMGATTSLLPAESCESQYVHPDCDRHAPDIDDATLDAVVFYVSTLGVPARRAINDPVVRVGQALFTVLGCASCHVPLLQRPIRLNAVLRCWPAVVRAMRNVVTIRRHGSDRFVLSDG